MNAIRQMQSLRSKQSSDNDKVGGARANEIIERVIDQVKVLLKGYVSAAVYQEAKHTQEQTLANVSVFKTKVEFIEQMLFN